MKPIEPKIRTQLYKSKYRQKEPNFFTTKKTICKLKRPPSEWDEIIANETTDKELISKIYKQLMKLNIIKINGPIKKTGQRTKQTFLQRGHTDG